MPFSPILNLPIITEEEERAERDALSEQERSRIYLDVHGSQLEVGHEDRIVSDSELESLAVAIAELPESEKSEYLEAQDLAPELVQAESPPGSFLRREHLNARDAATRLVSYWKQRKALFGSERAFLPLSLDGALRDDLQLINSALVLPLPNDSHGRPVVFWNRAGYESSGERYSADAVQRVFMFIAHKASYASHEGVVILNNMQGLSLRNSYFQSIVYRFLCMHPGRINKQQRVDRSLTKKFVALMAVLPFRILSHHICTGPGKSVGSLILPVLKLVYGRELRLRTRFHSGTIRELLRVLEEFGMSEEQAAPLYASAADRQALLQRWFAEQVTQNDDDVV